MSIVNHSPANQSPIGTIPNWSAGKKPYDSLDRRIAALLEDGSRWKYNYNDRSELTGAQRFWSDWSPVAGQQYGYDYDNIGNRKSASSGGDTNGCNLRQTVYTANNLNQYSSILTPGYEDILGVALATNSVMVNGGQADRKGEYFHLEISITNTNAPVWQTVGVSSGGSSTNGGFAFPANNQALSYDLDGNLSGLANSNRLRLDFVYDFQGRRLSKTVSSWNGSVASNPITNLFVYDGWNLLAELRNPQSAIRTYLWGLDLSGTEDGAGGIGGLLAVLEIANNQISSCHFASYDGNGNVMALAGAGNGFTSARYEYSPFGQLLRATGPMATANPFRFSTKFWDDETGLVCYPSRYYSPVLGRWLSRDPAEEDGGNNLFGFLGNNPLNAFDPMGETGTMVDTEAAMGAGEGMEVSGAGQAINIYYKVKDAVELYDDIQTLLYNGSGTEGDDDDMFTDLLSMGKGMLGGSFKKLGMADDRGGRGRFKNAGDALDQLESIEKAQKSVRSGKLKKAIDSIAKSKGRFKNAVRLIRTLKDAMDEFD